MDPKVESPRNGNAQTQVTENTYPKEGIKSLLKFYVVSDGI
jgi:hypothetical protein